MIIDKETFLKKTANLSELKNNIISYVFALYPDIDISKKEKYFDNVYFYYEQLQNAERKKFAIESESSENILNEFVNKDFRIKSIKLSSIRAYPKSKLPFGAILSNENDEPQNAIILGSNGSGKSSLYEAIEYCYCCRVGETELRTYNNLDDSDDAFKNYLAHFNSSFKDIFCEIETVDGLFDIHKDNLPKDVRERINPDTHFISDFDIYQKGKLDYTSNTDNSFHNTIASSLGLSKLLEFEKSIRAFTFYRRQTESRKINNLKKENSTLKTLIDTSLKSIEEKKLQLNNLILSTKKTNNEQKTQETLEQIGKTRQSIYSLDINIDAVKSKISDYVQLFKEYEIKKIKNGGYSELQFLKEGLQLLSKSENCPFCRNSQYKSEQIQVNVTQRIKEIELLTEKFQSLAKLKDELVDNFISFINQSLVFQNRINDNHISISNNPRFNTHIQIDLEILSLINDILNDDLILGIKEIEDKTNSMERLFKLLNNFTINLNLLDKYVLKINEKVDDKKSDLDEIENNIKSLLNGHSSSERIVIIKKEITDIKEQIQSSETKININTKEISSLREQLQAYDTVKNETTNYLKVLHSELNSEVEKAFTPIKNLVEKILGNFLKLDNRNIDLDIKKEEEIDFDTGEVLSEIITAQIKTEKNEYITVNKYFNTFHYRLFATLVSISIAIASRISTKVNLPLVLDDIFYACDFQNRATIELFLKSIFDSFQEFSTQKLQLILFTHDELIFESLINTTVENKIDDVIFARLFPHNEAIQQDGYMKIIYELPTYFPQQLINEILVES